MPEEGVFWFPSGREIAETSASAAMPHLVRLLTRRILVFFLPFQMFDTPASTTNQKGGKIEGENENKGMPSSIDA